MNQLTDTPVFHNDIEIDTLNEPLYTTLDDTIPQIRLVNIHFRQPDEADDSMIKCSMKTVSLHEVDSQYFALSYTWGNPNDQKPITINGRRHMVTINLEAFLQEWRASVFGQQNSPNLDIPFWIDAICINQEDILERSSQVNLMSKIYPSAKCVFCWLGRGLESCEYGLESIQILGEHVENFLEENDRTNYLSKRAWPNGFYLQDKDGVGYFDNEAWNGINDLFSVEYWDRAWIQQEFVLGQNLLFWYGRAAVNFRYVRFVMVWLDHIEDQSCPDFFNLRLWIRLTRNPYRQIFSMFDPLMRLAYLQVVSKNPTIMESPPVAFYLLHTVLTPVKSSDPRDLLYSLLGVVDLGIQADYGKTIEEIYYQFAEKWISKPRGLIFLLAAGGPCPISSHHIDSEHCSFPSWVPCWQSLRGSLQNIGIDLSERANSGPDLMQATVKITGRCLQTKGYIVSRVKWNKPINAENLALFLTIYLHDSTATNPNTSRNRFRLLLRFLSGNGRSISRGPLKFDPSSWNELLNVLRSVLFVFHKKFSLSLPDISRYMGIQTLGDIAERLFDEPIPSEIDPLEPTIKGTKVDTRVALDPDLAINLGAHPVFTTMDGHIGWSFRDLREDDVLCILFGLKTPVILRKVDDSFRYISPCNLPGFLDGNSPFVPTNIQEFDIY